MAGTSASPFAIADRLWANPERPPATPTRRPRLRSRQRSASCSVWRRRRRGTADDIIRAGGTRQVDAEFRSAPWRSCSSQRCSATPTSGREAGSTLFFRRPRSACSPWQRSCGSRAGHAAAMDAEYIKFLRVKGVPEGCHLEARAENSLIQVLALAGIQLGNLLRSGDCRTVQLAGHRQRDDRAISVATIR